MDQPNGIFQVGAFRVDGETCERGEGSALNTLRVRTGKALSKWLKATDSAAGGAQ